MHWAWRSAASTPVTRSAVHTPVTLVALGDSEFTRSAHTLVGRYSSATQAPNHHLLGSSLLTLRSLCTVCTCRTLAESMTGRSLAICACQCTRCPFAVCSLSTCQSARRSLGVHRRRLLASQSSHARHLLAAAHPSSCCRWAESMLKEPPIQHMYGNVQPELPANIPLQTTSKLHHYWTAAGCNSNTATRCITACQCMLST